MPGVLVLQGSESPITTTKLPSRPPPGDTANFVDAANWHAARLARAPGVQRGSFWGCRSGRGRLSEEVLEAL